MTPYPQTGLDPQAIFAVLAAAIKSQALAEQQSKPQQSQGPRLLTPKQAGEYIGRSESAVRQMVFKQQIPVVRIGRNIRIDRLDLDRMIDEFKM
jgi:excisionase family DNA binding protein